MSGFVYTARMPRERPEVYAQAAEWGGMAVMYGVRSLHEFAPSDALDLAHWIIDTFGEPNATEGSAS